MQCCKAIQPVTSLHKKFRHTDWLTWEAKSKQVNRHITGKELKKAVAENLDLLVVHFKTEWNGACQILAPVYEDLASAYKHTAKFFTIDAEKNKTTAHEYGVSEIPTILFFKNGEVVDYVSGLTPKHIIVSKIENALTSTHN
jgi:thioredoxin 1